LYGDHLGSASLTTGATTNQARYLPFGGTRWDNGVGTDLQFTGQRRDANDGLYDFNARFYDPLLGRFLSADSVVPGAGNPQALNRYAYSYNNPLKYTDPSGHCPNSFCYFVAGFFAQLGYTSDPIPSGYVGSADALAVQPNDEPDAMLYGRLTGSVASGVLSYVEIAAGITVGTGGGIGGALACVPTAGGGCVVGAGAVALGAGLVTEGALTGANGANSAGQTAAILMARRGKAGGGSTQSPQGFPSDPSEPPAKGWQWRGKGDPGSSQGSWVNPDTGESLHWDTTHHGVEHWDYVDPEGNEFWIWQDGTMDPKP